MGVSTIFGVVSEATLKVGKGLVLVSFVVGADACFAVGLGGLPEELLLFFLFDAGNLGIPADIFGFFLEELFLMGLSSGNPREDHARNEE